MSSPQIQILLTLLSVALLLSRVSGAPRGEGPPDVLQERTPEGKEELSRIMVLRLISDLLRSENKAFPSSDKRDLLQDGTVHRLNSPRDRKAGCKNFFWKTFTSC
ncbi:somatostatin-1A-like [Heptranchias perlo]|uniref:somatostatin-1A-like n=1 Tax=Heptranchias perlo TaxID=212740 RepID=UPI003559545A